MRVIPAIVICLLLYAAVPVMGSAPIIRVGLFRTTKIQSATILSSQGLRVVSTPDMNTGSGVTDQIYVRASGSDLIIGRRSHLAQTRVRSAVVSGAGGSTVVGVGSVSRVLRGTVRVTSRRGELTLVNDLPLEDYVIGVLANEMPPQWPSEAQKSQAVVVRTLALARIGAHQSEGFDLCDTTHCQVYRGAGASSAATITAARATTGQVLIWRGRPIESLYCSTCGGATASGFGGRGVSEASFLTAKQDKLNNADACKDSPHYAWKATVSSAQLKKALQSDRRVNPGSELKGLRVTRYDGSQRAAAVEIRGTRTIEADGYVFWTVISRALGWGVVKSARFRVSRNGTDYVFSGHGLGHGVGLCQWGAKKRAEAGWNYRRILDFYYPGCNIGQAAIKRSPGRP